MTRVLIDGRIDRHDGIGRYTTCLIGALRVQAGPSVTINVLPPTGTPRYSQAEGTELLGAARACRADVIHLLDYRVPLEPTAAPLVVTIHDILRLVRPQFCYSDEQFAARFGTTGLAELAATTSALRRLTDPPQGSRPVPAGLHEEFYGRMLALACGRACAVITPTQTVARQLTAAIGHDRPVRVSAWGIDHVPTPHAPDVDRPPVDGRYLLYVGQARAHKGLEALLNAYQRSQAPDAGVRLVCAGRDFADGTHTTTSIKERLGGAAVTLGSVPDSTLWALYAQAESLVHLAEHEGFGFTPLEALSTGTRVLASNIPTLRETLADHALFADPADIAAVTKAINHLVTTRDEPGSRRRRARWARRYQWSRHANDVLAVYREADRCRHGSEAVGVSWTAGHRRGTLW